MDIVEQKNVAVKVLSKMSRIDPDCIVAGGAVRDWYMENPCRDIDIYYRISKAYDKHLVPILFNGVGFVDNPIYEVQQGNRGIEDYHTAMASFVHVFETVYLAQKIQFIGLDFRDAQKKPESVVDEFTCNICAGYMKKDGILVLSDRMKDALTYKTIICKHKHHPHTRKMVEKFGNGYNIVFGDTQEYRVAGGK